MKMLLNYGGANMLRKKYGIANSVVIRDVTVVMDFNEGNPCCGGSDPDCYCSFEEAPSANVAISGYDDRPNSRNHLEYLISYEDFSFLDILGQIVVAGGGTLKNR